MPKPKSEGRSRPSGSFPQRGLLFWRCDSCCWGGSAMRVAAIYDIHGNLPALEAVLEEVRQEDVDHVVVGGDVVPGPMVRETLARLLALDVPVRFIQGNCEVAVLEAMAGRDQPAVPEQHRPKCSFATARREMTTSVLLV